MEQQGNTLPKWAQAQIEQFSRWSNEIAVRKVGQSIFLRSDEDEDFQYVKDVDYYPFQELEYGNAPVRRLYLLREGQEAVEIQLPAYWFSFRRSKSGKTLILRWMDNDPKTGDFLRIWAFDANGNRLS